MEQILSCPKCTHDFCLACLKQTWKRPIGKARYRMDVGFYAEIELVCCACKTVNEAHYWTVTKVPKKKDKSAKKQMDLFRK